MINYKKNQILKMEEGMLYIKLQTKEGVLQKKREKLQKKNLQKIFLGLTEIYMEPPRYQMVCALQQNAILKHLWATSAGMS